MKVLTPLTGTAGLNISSPSVDRITLGSSGSENNDANVDNLTVWANADFRNNITLGSSATDTLLVKTPINASGTLILDSTNASASGDIAVKIGTTITASSVNAATRLVSARTGINSTENEIMFVRKDGSIGSANGKFIGSAEAVPSVYVLVEGGGTHLGYGGTELAWGFGGLSIHDGTTYRASWSTAGKIATTGIAGVDYVGSGANFNSALKLYSPIGTSSAEITVKAGSTLLDSSVDASAKLLSVRTGLTGSEIEYFSVTKTQTSASKFIGNASGLINVPTSSTDIIAINAGSNLTGGGTSGNLSLALTSSITGGLSSISGLTVLSTTNLSASFITGSTITGSTITGSTALFTTITGSTITGSFAKYTTITGSTITGSAALVTTITGSTITGSAALFTTITGSTAFITQLTSSRAFISSSDGTTNGSTLTLYGSGSTQPVFAIQGSQGQLFSVVDSLSGSLFSVNDISGLPILEVFSDNTIIQGNYAAPALYTTVKNTLSSTGTFNVYNIPTASYDAAFFDYVARSGSNARAGKIMTIWSGSSVNFTESKSSDFGSTTGLTFGAYISGSVMILTGSASTSGWTIKTIVRSI